MAEERIQPDMVVYGTLISAAQKAGEGQAADAWLQRALQDGIRLDKNCPLESMESLERQISANFWTFPLLLLAAANLAGR